jgi:hypothetical protein
MKRTDSGFHESFLSTLPSDRPTCVARSHTAPVRRRNPNKPTIDPPSAVLSAGMNSHRPVSNHRSRPAYQRSKTSASNASPTRSRGHGHGSKPSSSRTSCTIVDPSRSRHYRMQSSNTVPTATRQDIDDVYALHHRSYNMFQNPSLHTRSGLPSPSLSHAEQYGFPCANPRFSADEAGTFNQEALPKQSEETLELSNRAATTTMHWTSPCTRKREYERIDRANNGFRGFLNKVMPRCVSGPQEKFYEKDQSDAGSVRRYRIEDEERKEKSRARSDSRAVGKPIVGKKRWICF